MEIVDGKILCTGCLKWKQKESFVKKTSSLTGYTRICKLCKKKENAKYATTARMPKLMQELADAPLRAVQRLVELDQRTAVAAANTNLALYDQLLAEETELVEHRIKIRKEQYKKRIYNVKGHINKNLKNGSLA